MKIMSFNTQHCLGFIEKKIDFQLMADAICQAQPDIVGLNEMRDFGPDGEYDAQTAILSELTGLCHHYFAQAIDINGNPYGNGLLSKLPLISTETIPIPDPNPKRGTAYYESRSLLKARLEGGITVLVTHFGLNEDEQKNAVDCILAHMESEKCILMGDFNTTPEAEVLNPIRACMKDAADGFLEPLLSFPSDIHNQKIDYIFVTPDVEILSADIPEIIASDHRPHVATLNL